MLFMLEVFLKMKYAPPESDDFGCIQNPIVKSPDKSRIVDVAVKNPEP